MLRLNRFLLHRFGIERGDENKGAAHRFLVHSHIGYFPHADEHVTPHAERHMLRYPVDSRVTVLLRDAKAVIASVYHYRRRLGLSVGDSVDDFVRGKAGVSLFCAYTHDLALIERRAKQDRLRIEYVYYEDMFSPEFVDRVPFLLGLGCSLTDTEREAIAEDSNYLVHPSRMRERFADVDAGYQETKYQETIADGAARHIDGHLREHCRLPAYTDRYC